MAIRFDASTDRILRTTSLFGYNAAYTRMAWIYLTSDLNAQTTLLASSDNNLASINADIVACNTDGVTLPLSVAVAGTPTVVTGSVLSTGTWYHVAVVRTSATNALVYLNGVLDITNTANVTGRTAQSRLEAGALSSSNLFRHNGRIAYQRIWTSALSQAQIQAEMNATVAVASSPWLDSPHDPDATRLDDISGNARHWSSAGTLTDEAGPTLAGPIAPSLLTNTSTLYLPTLSQTSAIAPSLLTNTSTLYAPSLLTGNVNLAPSLLTNTSTLYTPGVSTPQSIAPSLLTNTSTLYAPGLATTTVLDIPIGANGDDGHWEAGGSYSNSGTEVLGGNNGGASFNGWARVPLAIAPGATVSTAYLTVTAAASATTTSCAVTISAEDSDNPAAPTDAADAESRTITTATVNWTAPTPWTAGDSHNSSEIKTILQERIDDPAWTSGDHILLFIKDNGSASNNRMRIAALENATHAEMSLHVEYSAPAAQSIAPSLLTNSSTLYTPTTAVGNVNIAPSLLTNTSTLYTPDVANFLQFLTPSLLTNSSTLYTPDVAGGGVQLAPSLLTNTSTLYTPTLVAGNVNIAPSLLTNTSTLYLPAVASAQSLAPSLLTNTSTLYTPSLTATYVILPSLLTNTSVFYLLEMAGGVVVRALQLTATGSLPVYTATGSLPVHTARGSLAVQTAIGSVPVLSATGSVPVHTARGSST